MRLGSPALSYTDVSARELAGDVAELLRQSTGPVHEVLELRLQAIDVALNMNSPELLGDQRSWESVRLANEGSELTPVDIDHGVLRVLAEHVDPEVLARIEHLQEITATTMLTDLAEAVPQPEAELTPSARAYIELGLAGRRDDALRLVQDALADGLTAPEVVMQILQPAQLELGRLWADGDITIAQEHYITGLTQVCLSSLYPAVPHQRSPDAPRMVAVTSGAEGHELGMRMVTDLMTAEGWNVAYLGAGLPIEEIVTFVGGTQPDVVAISVTMAAHIHSVRDLIAQLRDNRACAGIRVLVGGRPFALNPRLPTAVDADGWATGPREALQLCWLWVQRDRNELRV